MTKEEKIEWMQNWCERNGFILELNSEVGFGRKCVGIVCDGKFPDYHWYNEDYDYVDSNGDVWTPKDAYHKHECVAVLGLGESAEDQLYQWLKWFEENNFKKEVGDSEYTDNLEALFYLLDKDTYCRLVKKI